MGCGESTNKDPAPGPTPRPRPPPSLSRGVKMVLVGDSFTGKTSLVARLMHGQFMDTPATVEAAFQVHKLRVDDHDIKLEIWDTAGQERFRALTPMYYRGACAALIVYDITNADSFEAMKRWITELKQNAPGNIILGIAANKLDLADSARMVPTSVVEDYVQAQNKNDATVGGPHHHFFFVECSARTGQNVDKLFIELCKRLIIISDKSGAIVGASGTS
ncbi:Rab GTPase [Pelomyxa schiedti]|nr:Rab GTPase [Pelomyxa schiedti]